MNSQTNSMNKNKHISLEEIGKELPFSVPENYFDQFASQLEEQMGLNHVPVRKIIKPWMYMAAMFFGVLLMAQVSYIIYQNNSTRNAENYESYVLSQVDEAAMLDYYVDEQVK